MDNVKFYLRRIKTLAVQVRVIGDLLLCFDGKKLDYEKFRSLGLFIVDRADAIKANQQKLSQAFTAKNRKAKIPQDVAE